MERVAGTLIALSLVCFGARASADPLPARAKAQLPAKGEDDDSALRALLTSADRDGDARVTLSELATLAKAEVLKQVAARFARLDRNHDGRVTHDEVPQMDQERFARFDRDRDGSFTLVELSDVLCAQATHRCQLLLARLDADQDGMLSELDLGPNPKTRVSKLEPNTALVRDAVLGAPAPRRD